MIDSRATRLLSAACALALAACGAGLPGGSPGTGGAVATGGVTGTGGLPLDGCDSVYTGSRYPTPPPSSISWIDRTAGTDAQNLTWTSVASDASGKHLIAATLRSGFAPDGNIWTSDDGGLTWKNRTAGTAAAGQHWSSVASDSTGAHLAAVTGSATGPGGDVWTSSDAGVTWTKRTTFAPLPPDVVVPGPILASDATGARLVATNGDVWTSVDFGVTWTDQTAGTDAAGQIWGDVASDATGDHLIATSDSGGADLWTSSDAGQTWTNRTQGTPAGNLGWQGVASDATGSHLVAICQRLTPDCGGGGSVWTSADFGVTWTNRTAGTAASGQEWKAVASDATGANFIAASWGELWTSADMGTTWTDETRGTAASGWTWDAVASDATGAHLVATSDGFPVPMDVNVNVNGAPIEGDIWTRPVP